MKRVLLLGHRSFVGLGLEERLRREGFAVTTFRRGPLSASGDEVTGSVMSLETNPHLDAHFDAVVNLILLKDEPLDANVEFVAGLASFVEKRKVPHLVHVSSISSYDDKSHCITEDSPTEIEPLRKGNYGRLKVATDLALISQAKGCFALTLVRPGFVIAEGLVSPMVGMGARIPGNGLLVLGSGKDTVPVVRRTDVHEAIVAILLKAPPQDLNVALLADKQSPSRAEYLAWCAKGLGVSSWTLSLPTPLWLTMGAVGRPLSQFLPGQVNPWRVARSLTRTRAFDGHVTEQELGLDISVDWQSEIRRGMAGQDLNFSFPPPVVTPLTVGAGTVSILGFGGIVRQKHLPALRRLNFTGTIEGFDTVAPRTVDGITVNPIPDSPIAGSTLTIVASPGPVHAEAIRILPKDDSAILVEKPLCMTGSELDEWLRFASDRPGFTGVLHNYRFKTNVQRLCSTLQERHPGRLLHAQVLFQSPPVAGDLPWRRAERKARTLLMDYSLHFLDLATMFGRKSWLPRDVRFSLNQNGETDFIGGTLHSAEYDVSFVLRQGFMPREASIRFVFQNYTATLSFFPDELSLTMSGDDFGVALKRSGALLGGLVSKIYDKLTKGDKDASHATVLAQALVAPKDLDDLSVHNLAAFYRGVFELGNLVYVDAPVTA